MTAFNDGPEAADGAIVRELASAGLAFTSVTYLGNGGAIRPSTTISMPALQGAGFSLTAFPASYRLVFSLICGATATRL